MNYASMPRERLHLSQYLMPSALKAKIPKQHAKCARCVSFSKFHVKCVDVMVLLFSIIPHSWTDLIRVGLSSDKGDAL